MLRGRTRSKPRNKKNQYERRRPCPFCQTKTVPDYKDYQQLEKFLSPRARILSRGKSGVCAKHQRRLAEAVKQARHLALLSFVVERS